MRAPSTVSVTPPGVGPTCERSSNDARLPLSGATRVFPRRLTSLSAWSGGILKPAKRCGNFVGALPHCCCVWTKQGAFPWHRDSPPGFWDSSTSKFCRQESCEPLRTSHYIRVAVLECFKVGTIFSFGVGFFFFSFSLFLALCIYAAKVVKSRPPGLLRFEVATFFSFRIFSVWENLQSWSPT